MRDQIPLTLSSCFASLRFAAHPEGIAHHKAMTPSAASGGVLLGAGLNGHLRAMSYFQVFVHLHSVGGGGGGANKSGQRRF
jgi:hypothetical protein